MRDTRPSWPFFAFLQPKQQGKFLAFDATPDGALWDLSCETQRCTYIHRDAARAWQAFRDWCGPSRVCVWTQSEHDLWETDCNGAFQLNDGGPYANDMSACCYCGGALVERPYDDAEKHSDD